MSENERNENDPVRIEKRDLAPMHCASDDSTRWNLFGVRFDAARRRVIATDGHVMAWVSLPEGLERAGTFGLAPDEALRLARLKHGAIVDVDATRANGHLRVSECPSRHSPLAGSGCWSEYAKHEGVGGSEWPRVEQVIPDADAPGTRRLGLSVDVLEQVVKVAKARGVRHLDIRVPKDAPSSKEEGAARCVMGPVLILATDEAESGFGIVAMPCRVE